MKRFNFSSATKLGWFFIKVNRKQIIGWCLAIFSIMFLYMILFPSVKDMAQIKLDAMPQELLQFVGMDDFSNVSNYITYFGMIFNIILIAISIFAASFSANLIFKEEKRKTIEFLYALEVDRYEIYVSKFITAFFAVFIVVCSAVISAGICGVMSGGPTFIFMDFVRIVKVSGFTPFFFMSISLMIAGISTKIGAPMVGSMTVLLSYVLGFLSKLLGDKAQWLNKFSPFEMFKPQNAVILDEGTLTAVIMYLFISVCFIVVGGVIYRHRDFNI